MPESEKTTHWLVSDMMLSALIAILSILTAYVAYVGGQADSESNTHYFEAQALLSDANELRLEDVAVMSNEMNYFFYSLENKLIGNEEVAQFYFDLLGEEALASMERPDGPFDEEYIEQMWADADALKEQAESTFEQASHENTRGDQYQLVLLILAVALSFMGWASLINEQKKMRLVFVILSLLALVVGIQQLLTI